MRHAPQRSFRRTVLVLLAAGVAFQASCASDHGSPRGTPSAAAARPQLEVSPFQSSLPPGPGPNWGEGPTLETVRDPATGVLSFPGERRAPRRSEWFAMVGDEKRPVPDIPMGDEAVIRRIILEGKFNNHVMNHLEVLSKSHGPRLTGSTNEEQAAEWARQQFASFGLDARLEVWGDIGVRFDRGPSTGKIFLPRPEPREGQAQSQPQSQQQAQPQSDLARSMQFSTPSWMRGTDGPQRGPVFKEPTTEDEWNQIKDKLAGAWLLVEPGPIQGQRGVRNMAGERYRQRAEIRKKQAENPQPIESLPVRDRALFAGIHGYISASRDLRDRVWTGAVPGWRDLTMDTIGKDLEVIVRQSDYDFINSRLADGEPVEVEFNLPHTFSAGPGGGRVPVVNVVADLKGATRPDEIIIVSGHLDSWDGPGSQGTIDNGTGVAVTIETARILAAAGARPDRTIRFILWTGEEQGLLGAREYVKQLGPALDKVSAMFNDDGGTNFQGGIPAADVMVPMLSAASAPTNAAFPAMPVRIRPTGAGIRTHSGSDHAAFNAVGVPGFFWDEVGRADYGWGWHTQNDRVDLAIPEYLMQSSTNSAIVAYNLASMPTLLPRGARADGSEQIRPTDRQPGGQPAPGQRQRREQTPEAAQPPAPSQPGPAPSNPQPATPEMVPFPPR